MEGSVIQLSKYRFERAVEVLNDAKTLLEQKSYASSVNRSYYSIFHALRAVTALDGFDSSKHGRVKVYIEKPDEKYCFHYAACYLPGYEWEDIYGFSDSEME